MANTPWYERAYRRSVIDMHITDHDPRFLAQFDAQTYVDRLVQAGAQSAVVYAHSHVGLTYFPTRVGEMNRNLQGKSSFAQVNELCHKHGIAVVAYMSLIFDRWAYEHHPEFRMHDADGKETWRRNRHGVCCPNSPYRDYVVSLVNELCSQYDFEGLRFDMTFWPAVCYCDNCRRRFAEEVGGELPTVVNWEDPRWAAFQRRREAWLAEFAAYETANVKRQKPNVSVEHQASTYTLDWRFGVSTPLVPANDFLQGDFYGDALQGSFARKLFYNLSPKRPAGFETSIAVDLGNMTALKSEDLLTCKASAALGDGSAFIFIDSIDPEGTLNPAVYERMQRVFAKTGPYERFIGGERTQDVAVYLSTESKCDFADNGKSVDDPQLSRRMPHVEAAVSAARGFRNAHIPFGVITRRDLGRLSRHAVIVLPNVLMMDDDEAQAFREYVRAGGKLYASRYTSLIGTDGVRRADLALGDVLGVRYAGETVEQFTYIGPTPGHEAHFPEFTAQHPAGMYAGQLRVRALPGAEVLGELVLPFTDPADPTRYSSIHNNPPGRHTGEPAVVLNRFGKGLAMYATGDLESADTSRGVFLALLRRLHDSWSFSADGPVPVEVTLFEQEGGKRSVVSLVNFQGELPNIPVEGMRVRVRLDGRTPQRLTVLPQGEPWPFTVREGCVEFVAPRIETLQMLMVEYAG